MIYNRISVDERRDRIRVTRAFMSEDSGNESLRHRAKRFQIKINSIEEVVPEERA